MSDARGRAIRRNRFGIACVLGLAGGLINAQGFRERVKVELVRVEVLATDGQGRPVKGLRPDEVHLRVDGRSVSIESFEEPSILPELPMATAPPQPLPAAIAAAPDAAPASHHPYSMAILVDETSSEQSNRQAVLRDLFQFLEAPLAPDVEVLLMRFDGTLRVECPWTSDAERLRRAASAISRHRVVSTLGAPGRLSDNPERGASRLDFDALEAVGRVRSSLAGLFDALRQFPEKSGHKALYFVTDGAPFLTPSEIARDLIKSSTSRITLADGPDAQRRAELEADRDSDLLHDSLAWDRTRTASILTDVARLALVRGIEIHPLLSAAHELDGRVRADRGFDRRATAQGDASLSRRSLRATATVPLTDIAADQAMEATAEATGGQAILSRRMFQDNLRREISERGAACVVSFRDPFAGDHRFHRIEITLERSGVRLRYRRGYRILDIRESLIEGAVNRLHVPADQNPLGARLQLDSLGEEKGLAVARIAVAYPAPPEAGGTVGDVGDVQVLGVCAVRDGALFQSDFSGRAEKTSSNGSTWLVRSGQIRVKRGNYRCSFAVRDDRTEITSYLTFDRKLP